MGLKPILPVIFFLICGVITNHFHRGDLLTSITVFPSSGPSHISGKGGDFCFPDPGDVGLVVFTGIPFWGTQPAHMVALEVWNLGRQNGKPPGFQTKPRYICFFCFYLKDFHGDFDGSKTSKNWSLMGHIIPTKLNKDHLPHDFKGHPIFLIKLIKPYIHGGYGYLTQDGILPASLSVTRRTFRIKTVPLFSVGSG